MTRPSGVEKAYSLVPLLIVAPVIVGILITFGHIVTTRYPDLGWSQTLANDGRALAVGVPLYAKPGQQYTGMLYVPLMAAMLAPLYRIFWWDGWSLALVLASSVGLAGLVGGIAASGPNRPRWERITGGIGIGGVGFWILTTNPWHGMFTGRLDPLSWLFALGGLCVLALAVAHRWPRIWPAVLLLTAGFWTKQPTIAVVVTALVVATLWAATGVMPWRTWRRFVGGLALTNVVLFAVLLVVTHGWIWFFFFDLPSRHTGDTAITPYVSEFVRLFAVPVLAVVVAAARHGSRPARRRRRDRS